MTSLRLLTAAAIAAAGIGLAAPASAQSASYCQNGVLKALAFYSNILSNGATANVEYHGQFQNQDPQRRKLTATMVAIQQISVGGRNFAVVRPITEITLEPYASQDVRILTIPVQNPSGSGAPSPPQVGQTIRFNCRFG